MPTGDAAARVREMSWYHTIDLGAGLVTDGWFDLRPHVASYGLPERMDGMRVLDIGTWDGFWAFEMERRGAEVVALDVEHESEYDWPPRRRPAAVRGLPARRRLPAAQGDHSARRSSGCTATSTRPRPRSSAPSTSCSAASCWSTCATSCWRSSGSPSLCHGRLVLAEEYDRADQPAAVPRVALPRRPGRGRGVLAAARADLEADGLHRRLRRRPRARHLQADDPWRGRQASSRSPTWCCTPRAARR